MYQIITPAVTIPQLAPILTTPGSIDQNYSCQICDKKRHLTKTCSQLHNFSARLVEASVTDSTQQVNSVQTSDSTHIIAMSAAAQCR